MQDEDVNVKLEALEQKLDAAIALLSKIETPEQAETRRIRQMMAFQSFQNDPRFMD